MPTIKSIIVDDEESARNVLEKLLKRSSQDIEVMAKCADLPSGVDAIKQHKPDVVFLDIQMPNYAGYEIRNFFDEIDFEIIFVTAYDEYALKAFEVAAIDYLLKPIRIDRLKTSLDKLNQRIEEKTSKDQLELLQNTLQTKEFKKIALVEKGYRYMINVSDIAALQAQESYTKIFLADGQTYLSSKHLKHYERTLEELGLFFRSHKSWIINADYFESYSKSKLEIKLSTGIIAKLSKYRKPEFEQYISADKQG